MPDVNLKAYRLSSWSLFQHCIATCKFRQHITALLFFRLTKFRLHADLIPSLGAALIPSERTLPIAGVRKASRELRC